jgi:bleomycin hydrolase
MKAFNLTIIGALALSLTFAQQPQKDKGIFKQFKPGYFQQTILKGIEDFEKPVELPKTPGTFKVDPSNIDFPANRIEFTSFWHNEPVSQGNTNTCWSFSTTSFLESEVYRITGQKVKLSEIYTVYWEYVERARNWVQTRGHMSFGEGSEGNAVTRIWTKYGIVPMGIYSGLKPGQTIHSHEKMFNEMKTYLEYVKQNSMWDESSVVATIKNIMDYYIGTPPAKMVINGKEMTPKEYLTGILKIYPEDYCDVLSYMQQPYYKQVEYQVPDNWWHDKSYYNVPLDVFMDILKNSIKKGYTMSIGGDVSEPGFLSAEKNAAIIPEFDIPSSYIDENARQFRFSNETTTDDHGMHLVGYTEKNGVNWFLIKDSGSGSRFGGKENNPNFGYYFFREDYIKLKMMDFMVHKDMLKDILPKFK